MDILGQAAVTALTLMSGAAGAFQEASQNPPENEPAPDAATIQTETPLVDTTAQASVETAPAQVVVEATSTPEPEPQIPPQIPATTTPVVENPEPPVEPIVEPERIEQSPRIRTPISPAPSARQTPLSQTHATQTAATATPVIAAPIEETPSDDPNFALTAAAANAAPSTSVLVASAGATLALMLLLGTIGYLVRIDMRLV